MGTGFVQREEEGAERKKVEGWRGDNDFGRRVEGGGGKILYDGG